MKKKLKLKQKYLFFSDRTYIFEILSLAINFLIINYIKEL